MQTELGFEVGGRFTMPSSEPPGLEAGQLITVTFGDRPVICTVTKVLIDGDQRTIVFSLPAVTRIDP